MAKKQNAEVAHDHEEGHVDPAVVADLRSQLVEVAIGAGVAAADAALVYVEGSLDRIEFGRFKGTIVSLAKIAIAELRNLLHGGQVQV